MTISMGRRVVLFGSFFGALVAAKGAAAAPSDPRTSLHEEENFAVSPHCVYEALLDEKQFTAFSGMPAKINRGEGGAASLFGGQILARNVELVPDKRIVQAWRPADWTPGIWSMLKFELTANGAGTHVVLDQAGFPAGQYVSLDKGWHEHYLAPMKKYLR